MSSQYTRDAISDQQALVIDLKEIESMVEVCRTSQEIQTLTEGQAICNVLLQTVNRLTELHQAQAEKLEEMNLIHGESFGGKS